jgi:hypothetical protein
VDTGHGTAHGLGGGSGQTDRQGGIVLGGFLFFFYFYFYFFWGGFFDNLSHVRSLADNFLFSTLLKFVVNID